MEKSKVTYEESMQLQQAVEYLRALIDDLEQGEFVITSEGESLSFKPMGEVQLEVELEHKKGKQELEIELSWKSEDYIEEEEDEEEEGSALVATEEPGESGKEPGKSGSMGKMLPVAGLAIAGGLIAAAVKGKRKKNKIEKVLEKGREEANKLTEEGGRLIEEGEKIIEEGREEVAKRLARAKRAHKGRKPLAII